MKLMLSLTVLSHDQFVSFQMTLFGNTDLFLDLQVHNIWSHAHKYLQFCSIFIIIQVCNDWLLCRIPVVCVVHPTNLFQKLSIWTFWSLQHEIKMVKNKIKVVTLHCSMFSSLYTMALLLKANRCTITLASFHIH